MREKPSDDAGLTTPGLRPGHACVNHPRHASSENNGNKAAAQAAESLAKLRVKFKGARTELARNKLLDKAFKISPSAVLV